MNIVTGFQNLGTQWSTKSSFISKNCTSKTQILNMQPSNIWHGKVKESLSILVLAHNNMLQATTNGFYSFTFFT